MEVILIEGCYDLNMWNCPRDRDKEREFIGEKGSERQGEKKMTEHSIVFSFFLFLS